MALCRHACFLNLQNVEIVFILLIHHQPSSIQTPKITTKARLGDVIFGPVGISRFFPTVTHTESRQTPAAPD